MMSKLLAIMAGSMSDGAEMISESTHRTMSWSRNTLQLQQQPLSPLHYPIDNNGMRLRYMSEENELRCCAY